MTRRRTASGFTLIKTVLVIALFAFTVILASNIFINTQRAQIAAGSYDRLVADTRTVLSTETDCMALAFTKVGVDVKTTVKYTDQRPYTVTAEERLYNWRPGSVGP